MRNCTLPGRHITDRQMRLYMSFRHTETPTVAAARAGFEASTGYRFERDFRLPFAEKGTARPAAAGSAGRGLGQRGGAAAQEHSGLAAGRHLR